MNLFEGLRDMWRDCVLSEMLANTMFRFEMVGLYLGKKLRI